MITNTPQPDWADEAVKSMLEDADFPMLTAEGWKLPTDSARAANLIRQAAANHYLPELRMAEEAIDALLKDCPVGMECNDFHHAKKDWHEHFHDCQPMKRWQKALEDASAALARIQALTHPKSSPHEQIT